MTWRRQHAVDPELTRTGSRRSRFSVHASRFAFRFLVQFVVRSTFVFQGNVSCAYGVFTGDMRGWRWPWPAIVFAFLILGVASRAGLRAQEPVSTTAAGGPTVTLHRAPALVLTGKVDSNSPAVWDRHNGLNLFYLFTSFAGLPSLALGTSLQRMASAQPVTLEGFDAGGYWLEAVVQDVDGTLYGYFHNERSATECRDTTKAIPRIVAARSTDQGRSWENLGVVIESSRGMLDCSTTNKYFVGGVGDLSVMLDAESKDLYIFYSEYSRAVSSQGVGVARLLWADRDEPAGKVDIWRAGIWQSAREVRQTRDDGTTVIRLLYPSARPLFPTTDSWHDDNTSTDAFWGPSIHWNTYLQQYVMLLNRAKNSAFDQEGIYVSFSPVLHDPSRWSTPQRIITGGSWYPQVLGLEAGVGSDKVAGEWARLFLTGRSEYVIEFSK